MILKKCKIQASNHRWQEPRTVICDQNCIGVIVLLVHRKLLWMSFQSSFDRGDKVIGRASQFLLDWMKWLDFLISVFENMTQYYITPWQLLPESTVIRNCELQETG